MAMAYVDWTTKRIPDKWIVLLIFISVFGIVFVHGDICIEQRVAGVFVVSVLLLMLACIVQGSIGGGDIKLMAAGGFLLGVEGIWNAFCIGVVLSGLFVIALLITKKADRKTEIALGPFLCIGMLIILAGN